MKKPKKSHLGKHLTLKAATPSELKVRQKWRTSSRSVPLAKIRTSSQFRSSLSKRTSSRSRSLIRSFLAATFVTLFNLNRTIWITKVEEIWWVPEVLQKVIGHLMYRQITCKVPFKRLSKHKKCVQITLSLTMFNAKWFFDGLLTNLKVNLIWPKKLVQFLVP